MKTLFILIAISTCLLFSNFSCHNQKEKLENERNANFKKAKVVKYNAEKCMCCQFWTLEIDGEKVKSNDQKIGQAIGYRFNKPVEVMVKLGKQDNCKHYEIIEIKN